MAPWKKKKFPRWLWCIQTKELCWGIIWCCIPQAWKPGRCPASRLNKECRDSDRDINGLFLHVWNKSVLEWHPTAYGRLQAGHGSNLPYSGEKGDTIYGELTSGGLISYQGSQQLGWGQAGRQLLIKPYNSEDWIVTWIKQGLVEQMNREQENSHLEWPDHTTFIWHFMINRTFK